MAPALKRPTMSPTVSRIVSALKDRIRSGEYKQGDWLPPERALATEFQVSRILIRAAVKELERQHLVTCSIHRRPLVQGVSRAEAETPLAASRSLALWIWPSPTWPGSALILQGIQEALGSEFRLVVGTATGETWEEMYAQEARFLQQVHRDRDVEGLIISYMGGSTNLPYLENLRAVNIPMVFLDHLPPMGFEADYVGVNNKRAAEQAVRHLVTSGHRRIAHVSNFDTLSTVAERLAGYRRALESAEIPFCPELVEQDPGPSSDDPEEGCEALIGRLLSLPDPPTAIFAVHDVIAYRVMAALRARGLRVPEDISLVGFDGIERWMPSRPFLTTMYQPFETMGAQAMDLLRERLQEGPKTVYKHAILEARLAVHESTRPLCRPDAKTSQNFD